jgi:hypothetical protein
MDYQNYLARLKRQSAKPAITCGVIAKLRYWRRHSFRRVLETAKCRKPAYLAHNRVHGSSAASGEYAAHARTVALTFGPRRSIYSATIEKEERERYGIRP